MLYNLKKYITSNYSLAFFQYLLSIECPAVKIYHEITKICFAYKKKCFRARDLHMRNLFSLFSNNRIF